MAYLFNANEETGTEAAENFNEDISRWDVSKVTTMRGMFACASAFNGNLSLWDVSNVTTMEGMFNGASAFNGNLSSWNVSNVTEMAAMFYEAKAFNKDTIKNWNLEGKDLGKGLFEDFR